MLKDFTSLSPAEEQQFLVYEQRMTEVGSKATKLGAIVGGCVFVLALIIYFSGSSDMSEWEKQDQEDAKAMGAEKEKAADTPAKDEAAEAPAKEEAKDEAAEGADKAEGAEGAAAEAPSEGAAEAPAPPKGATKAPPTALTH